ncbi:hypothetical protein [Brachybacterium sp. UMB0905]|uniref:hypothetical protein n=1 Tax=Brachybacterium sp. UMB0905 TaxID=2069310 RepID=UPI0011AF5DB2|nr:hypothetical protein [Brachybacterium sp. UMB0905]
MSGLSPDAVELLGEHGLTAHQWAQLNGARGQWTGDVCGCPDPRCVGSHHDAGEACRCLPVLIAELIRDGSTLAPV